MKAAAIALKIDISILKDARAKACPAFSGGNGAVHRVRLLDWLKNNVSLSSIPAPNFAPQSESPTDDENNFVDDYNPQDEAGGVGQTLKSLQAYERRLKQKLDKLERSTNLMPSIKADFIEKAQKGWVTIVNALLRYDLSVSQAKRESGELIPMADAVKTINAILAWHTVAMSDALRNVIPRLEGKDKYQIAELLDPALRSSIYRNFKMGVKLGKIPEWAGKSASDFVKAEAPLSIEPSKLNTMEDPFFN